MVVSYLSMVMLIKGLCFLGLEIYGVKFDEHVIIYCILENVVVF